MKLKFSKPKNIGVLSKTKSIIEKCMAMLGGDTGLSYLVKCVGFSTPSFPLSKNRANVLVITGFQ